MRLAQRCAARSALLDLAQIAELGGNVELAGRGSLPNDGKVIADER
jgi:hypothetical protein